MFGMIKKDLFTFKNNLKSIIIMLLLYFFYTITLDMNMTFLLPFMTLMIVITVFNYDDYNNWHSYASSFPQGKVNVVKARYILLVSLVIISTIIGILLTLIISQFKTTLSIDESIGSALGTVVGISFMASILFPILFKYGSEKGRIAMISMGLIIACIIYILSKVVKIDFALLPTPDIYTTIAIVIVLSAIMLSISYLISKKIYLKKEF